MTRSWKQSIKNLKLAMDEPQMSTEAIAQLRVEQDEKLSALEAEITTMSQQAVQANAALDAEVATMSQQAAQSNAEHGTKLTNLDAGLATLTQQSAQSNAEQDTKLANLDAGLATLVQQSAQSNAEQGVKLAELGAQLKELTEFSSLSQQPAQPNAEADAKLAELDEALASLSQLAAQSNPGHDAKLADLDKQLQNLSELAQQLTKFNSERMAREQAQQGRSDHQQALAAGLVEELVAQEELRTNAQAQKEIDRLLAAGLVADAMRAQTPESLPETGYKPAKAQPLDDAFDRLKELNPRLFPIWRQLFENAKQDFELSPSTDGFFSHWDNEYARAFQAYLKVNAGGRILDIGCGPMGRPVYLSGFPAGAISGIDPLPARKAVDFERVQGFNEFLPWPDGSFNCVVNATSLDHVLSLDVAIAETARVLTRDGCFLLWIASVPESPAFDDSAEEFEAIDRYHLFHFERSWIEPMLEKHFRFVDITVIPQPGFDHVFYRLEPRPVA